MFTNFTGSEAHKWIIVLCVLTIGHAVSGKIGYDRLNSGMLGGLDLSATISQWSTALGPADAGTYLRVAKNFADGHGITDFCKECTPQDYIPFYFWGPGTPWVFGMVIKFTQATTMLPIFLFAWLWHWIGGLIIIATLRLYTRSLFPMVLTAIFTAICPPVYDYIYGYYLTSSETVAIVPLSLGLYFLGLALLHLRQSQIEPLSILLSFALSGLTLGLASLVRDSHYPFVLFSCFAITALFIFSGKKALGWAFIGVLVLFISCASVRLPVQLWNKKRSGAYIVASSSSGALWRYGLWSQHDQVDWYYTSGIGFGQYLDPDAAKKVLRAYDEGRGNTKMSFLALVSAILKKPWDAFRFKFDRLPVLWLGTLPFPRAVLTPVSAWCGGFYLLFFVYLFVSFRTGTWPSPIVYLYATFLGVSSLLIHYEFRYTFPVWITLNMVPGLLVSLPTKKDQTPESV